LSSDFSKKLKNEESYNILKTIILVAGLFISLVLWNRIFPDKVLVAKVFKNVKRFMEREVSSRSLGDAAARLYPDPVHAIHP
jgi:hypothetical protein